MAFDLSYLKPVNTTWLTLPDVRIGGSRDVELELQCAVGDDCAYRRELRRMAETLRRASATEHAELMRGIIAKTIIVSWRNVIGADGQPVAYTATGDRSGEELLAALADAKLGDRYTNLIDLVASDPSRFRDPLPAPVDVGNG